MDCGDDQFVLVLCQVGQDFYDFQRVETVQPRSWFVQDQTQRVRNQLDSHHYSLLLSSRDGLLLPASHIGVSDLVQIQDFEDLLHSLLPFQLRRVREFQLSLEIKSLYICLKESTFDSQRFQKKVILWYIRSDGNELFFWIFVSIKTCLNRKLFTLPLTLKFPE